MDERVGDYLSLSTLNCIHPECAKPASTWTGHVLAKRHNDAEMVIAGACSDHVSWLVTAPVGQRTGYLGPWETRMGVRL